MLVKGWIVIAIVIVLAIVAMLCIKESEEESLYRRYFRRIGVLTIFFIIGSTILYFLPTAIIVENNKQKDIIKVVGSTEIKTEWGTTIPLTDLEISSQYVVNKSPDTLVLFPIIYSNAGYKAYDTSTLTKDIVDVPPGHCHKAELDVSTFFIIPDESELRLTETRNEREYALLTRGQLNNIVNRIVIESSFE